jgi:hypothetical protein
MANYTLLSEYVKFNIMMISRFRFFSFDQMFENCFA